jgi:acetolactate synthase-1/2/3 large subunit
VPELTGARLLVRSLRAAGAEIVFSLSGNQILPIYDACLDEGLRVVDTRHESAAAHMADAYARLTGRPGICLVTAGPGHTNVLTGLANARYAESPVLLLSGGSERARAGRGAFQELDQVGLAAPLSKLSALAETAEALPELVAQAYRVMLAGRPGPVHLTLPADVLTAEAAAGTALPAADRFQPERPAAEAAAVEQAAAWLAAAERPVVLGGPSAGWGAVGLAFQRLLERTGLPGFVLESPRGLTDPALHGLGSQLRRADLALLLAPQDFVAGFAGPGALAESGRLIEVGAAAAALGQNRRPDLGLVGDQVSVLGQLTEALADGRGRAARAAWAAELAGRRADQRARLGPAETSDQEPIHPLRLCAEVRARLRPGDIATEDGGEFGQWARWALGGGQQRVVLNGKLGMIGCGLPFALGARLAAPEARVVAFLGDGTFGFHGFEFDTAVRHDLPFVAIVGNDAGWAAERHRQVALYGPERVVAADLLPTRYDQVAQALGAEGALVERLADLGPALDLAFASGRPTCLNVRIASLPSPAAAAG